MNNANSGYVGYSMSVRAKQAYDGGLLSKAKIKKSDLEGAGVQLPVSFVKWMMPAIIKPTEWHHTSIHFNKTDFYDLNEVKEQLDEIDIELRLTQYKCEKQDNHLEKGESHREKGYYAYVEYGEWGGTRKHPKLITHTDYAFIKGNWAHISDRQKKSVDGNHFKIVKTFNRKPKEMNTFVRDAIFKKLKMK